jgi:hypothetical protein
VMMYVMFRSCLSDRDIAAFMTRTEQLVSTASTRRNPCGEAR